MRVSVSEWIVCRCCRRLVGASRKRLHNVAQLRVVDPEPVMSDSDDTDVLLLIPPDFFLVHSDSETSYNDQNDYYDRRCSAVGTLMVHVSRLEERLNRIERSDNSLCSLSTLLPASEMSDTFNFAISSAKSTPQKPHSRFTSSSLPSTPSTYDNRYRPGCRRRERRGDADDSTASTTPDKKHNKKVLGEIDDFLSNVKSIQKFSGQNSGPMLIDESPLKLSDLRTEERTRGLDMKDVDRLLEEVEAQQRRIEQCDREIRNQSHVDSDPSEATKSTCRTVLENPRAEPLAVKRTDNSMSLSKSTDNTKLLSLNDLWGERSHGKLLPRLEEERLRRQHCERTINQLQAKVLEMQQRLAVAVQVDSAKDDAILKFHGAWERVTAHWATLEQHCNVLNSQLATLREKTDVELAEAAQKVAQCELEVSKALDLAHGNQEKLGHMELERGSLLRELEAAKSELESTRHKLTAVEKERQKLAEVMLQYERDSHKDRRAVTEARSELARLEKELKAARDDRDKLDAKLKTERQVNVQLENDKKNLQEAAEASKDVEKMLQQELRASQEQNERAKADLRNFYQQQVEILVRDKLKEFQLQLEQAEKSLQDEMQSREQNITRAAAKQLQRLAEKHQLEVRLLEEKHSEEARLHALQLDQCRQQAQALQARLEQHNARRTNIAQELRSVMEAQWQQALQIIDSSRTPAQGSDRSEREVPKPYQEEHSVVDIGESAYKSTPLSSRPAHAHQSEEDLQKYIKMLLEKLPGNPAEKVPTNQRNEAHGSQGSSANYVDLSTWNQVPIPGPRSTEIKMPNGPNRDPKSNKPPWK